MIVQEQVPQSVALHSSPITQTHSYSKETLLITPIGKEYGIDGTLGASYSLTSQHQEALLVEPCGPTYLYISERTLGSCPSEYGTATITLPPYQKRPLIRSITDTIVEDNRVLIQWRVIDRASLALSLGVTSEVLAKESHERKTKNAGIAKPYSSPQNTTTCDSEHTAAQHFKSHYEILFSIKPHREELYKGYYRAAQLTLSADATASGAKNCATLWKRYDCFSFHSFLPQSLICTHTGATAGPVVSMRWIVSAHHDRRGMFGSPTGKDIQIMGISHAQYHQSGTILYEWVCIDEVAIWELLT